MTTLRDITTRLKAELDKGEVANRNTILSLVDRIEPLASRDWARIKKLEKQGEALAGKTPEDIEKMAEELASAKAELERHTAALSEKNKLIEVKGKEHAAREKQLSDSLDGERVAMERLVLDTGPTSELVKANAKTSLMGAVKALIREKGVLRVEQDGTAGKVVAVEMREGKKIKRELADWVKDFLGSEEGKEFVSAKANAGSGAGETHTTPGGDQHNSMEPDAFWALPAKDRAAYLSHGGTITAE